MSDSIRWGILGTGGIAHKMAGALKSLPDAEVVAVGSRASETAESFGDEFEIPRRYGSYEGLANDPNVEIIYVSTPHNYHKANTMLCLELGKSVLCEKPFALNAKEVREMIVCARERQLFLMEAMWTRFLPAMQEFKKRLDSGAIGEVRMLQADFGYRAEFNPESRIFNPNLAGGGLLDVGVYPLALASWVFGTPARIASMAEIGQTGIDEQCAIILGYSEGQMALVSAAVRTNTPHTAVVMGSEGMIRIPTFWRAQGFTISAGGEEETVDVPSSDNGFEFEAQEVMRCLREGKTESPVMGLDESLDIARTMDAIRAEWRMVYPDER